MWRVSSLMYGLIAAITLAGLVARQLGVLIPNVAELAGFLTAATSFLALPYTLRTGGHIRVHLLLSRLQGRSSQFAEGWCLVFATALVGYLAWFTVNMTLQSYKYGTLSTGLIGIPLWIPQLSMCLGLVLLEVAFVEECIRFLTGRRLSYNEASEDHTVE